MTRSAGRVTSCPVDEGPVPLGPMPMSPRPEAAVLPVRAWAKAKPLPQTQRCGRGKRSF